MKKKLFAWILLVGAVLTLATGCSRRDQYREPIATTATIEMSTDETNIEETDPYAKNPSPLGTGNPYQNLDREDLKKLYFQSLIAQLPMRSVYNTPYYYLFHRGETQRGGLAYSKLTGKMVPLCKELACDHSDCLFSWAFAVHLLIFFQVSADVFAYRKPRYAKPKQGRFQTAVAHVPSFAWLKALTRKAYIRQLSTGQYQVARLPYHRSWISQKWRRLFPRGILRRFRLGFTECLRQRFAEFFSNFV